MNSSLGDGNPSLLHDLMNGCTIKITHLKTKNTNKQKILFFGCSSKHNIGLNLQANLCSELHESKNWLYRFEVTQGEKLITKILNQ